MVGGPGLYSLAVSQERSRPAGDSPAPSVLLIIIKNSWPDNITSYIGQTG